LKVPPLPNSVPDQLFAKQRLELGKGQFIKVLHKREKWGRLGVCYRL